MQNWYHITATHYGAGPVVSYYKQSDLSVEELKEEVDNDTCGPYKSIVIREAVIDAEGYEIFPTTK